LVRADIIYLAGFVVVDPPRGTGTRGWPDGGRFRRDALGQVGDDAGGAHAAGGDGGGDRTAIVYRFKDCDPFRGDVRDGRR
jgi:hypothetical protein